MKLKKILLTILGLGMLGACSDVMEEPALDNPPPATTATRSNHISESEAVFMADSVLGHDGRTRALDIREVQYILASNTRSHIGGLDTIAYVINYTADGGFAMIAGDRRVNPVLAYSQTNQFDPQLECTKEFTGRLEAYLDNGIEENEQHVVEENDSLACFQVVPQLNCSIHQGHPFNKYVVEEHPDCPAGCVAVATALIMSHVRDRFIYHDTDYDFARIRVRLGHEHNGMSWDEAADYMANLLYWIGKDLIIDYNPGGSWSTGSKAYNLMKELKFDVATRGYINYNAKNVVKYLDAGCIVFMGGSGHAWVADGALFCVEDPETYVRGILPDFSNVQGPIIPILPPDHYQPVRNEMLNPYIHIDWGWGGSCNGYYSGEVFSTSAGDYRPTGYFAVFKNK